LGESESSVSGKGGGAKKETHSLLIDEFEVIEGTIVKKEWEHVSRKGVPKGHGT